MIKESNVARNGGDREITQSLVRDGTQRKVDEETLLQNRRHAPVFRKNL